VNKHLFIHSPAGYGKTNIISKMQQIIKYGIIYAAPTGLAAYHINGITIHSLFNLKPCIQNPFDKNITISDSHKLSLLRNANTLVIDEISMIRCDLLDKINEILKIIRNNNEPFGGLRMILFGDLFQLTPIVIQNELNYLKELYKYNRDYYFFESNAFNEIDFLTNLECYELTHNYRQENDVPFQILLNNIRTANLSKIDLLLLNTRLFAQPVKDTMYLATNNKTVDCINAFSISNLPDEPTLSIPIIESIESIDSDLLKQYPYILPIIIKKDMKIRFTMNDSINNNRRFVNGTIGFIKEKIFKNNFLEYVIAEINGNEYDIRRETRMLYEPYYNAVLKQTEIREFASITQFPFISSYANTIHKSQGMTLDNAIVDMSGGSFCHGQTYVALSRVKTLNNLFLIKPITLNDIKVSKSIVLFYRTILPSINLVVADNEDNNSKISSSTILMSIYSSMYKKYKYASFPDRSTVICFPKFINKSNKKHYQ